MTERRLISAFHPLRTVTYEGYARLCQEADALKKQDVAVLVAVGIGLSIVMPFHVITAHFARRPVLDETLGPVFISALLAALPFLALASKML
jgi:hypothetical protein